MDAQYATSPSCARLRAAMEARVGGTYNVGGGSRSSLADAIDEIGALFGAPLKAAHQAVAAGDVRSTAADTTRAARDFGFVAQHGRGPRRGAAPRRRRRTGGLSAGAFSATGQLLEAVALDAGLRSALPAAGHRGSARAPARRSARAGVAVTGAAGTRPASRAGASPRAAPARSSSTPTRPRRSSASETALSATASAVTRLEMPWGAGQVAPLRQGHTPRSKLSTVHAVASFRRPRRGRLHRCASTFSHLTGHHAAGRRAQRPR